jgi:hypothetical protein
VVEKTDSRKPIQLGSDVFLILFGLGKKPFLQKKPPVKDFDASPVRKSPWINIGD